MESDYDHASAQQFNLSTMPPGLNKLRKTMWTRSFLKAVEKQFSRSSLALLQGQDVFDAYRHIAPNPHKVLNVQISPEDQVSAVQLQTKRDRIGTCLKAIYGISKAGVEFQAIWFGDGALLPEMMHEAASLGIADKISFPGSVGRQEIITTLQNTDIFLVLSQDRRITASPGSAGVRGRPRRLWHTVPARIGGEAWWRRIRRNGKRPVTRRYHRVTRQGSNET